MCWLSCCRHSRSVCRKTSRVTKLCTVSDLANKNKKELPKDTGHALVLAAIFSLLSLADVMRLILKPTSCLMLNFIVRLAVYIHIVACRVVGVAKKKGSISDDWNY